MRYIGIGMRAGLLTATLGLALAACASGLAQPRSHPRQAPPSTVPAAARPLAATLHQVAQRFVRTKGANPAAVMILASSRNLGPGQQGTVLTVQGVGNLIGSCAGGKPGVKFRLSYRGAGPPSVTRLDTSRAFPAGLHLLSPYYPPAPAQGKHQFVFFQITGGGESADFSLVAWATLTPVAGGCALTTNGVLRVRGSSFLKRLGSR